MPASGGKSVAKGIAVRPWLPVSSDRERLGSVRSYARQVAALSPSRAGSENERGDTRETKMYSEFKCPYAFLAFDPALTQHTGARNGRILFYRLAD